MKKLIVLLLPFLIIACSSSKRAPVSGADQIQKTKGNSVYYYLASNLQNLEGRDNLANLFMEKALKKDAHSTYLKLQRAYQLARISKFEEARQLVREAEKKDPQNAEAHILLGKIEISLGNSLEASNELKKALTIDPNNEEATILLSRQQATTGNTDEAIATLKKFSSINPESTRIYYLLANLYAADKKNFDLALREYKNILSYDPDDIKAWQLIAEIFLAKKNYNKALDALIRVREVNPQDLNTQVRIALLYFELKERDKAIEAFESILQDNPDADKIQYYLGLLYLDKEIYDKALLNFEAIKPKSSYYEDAVTRSIAVYLKQDNKQRALELATDVLRKNQNKKEFYELLASVHAVMERYDLALNTLKAGLKLAPGNEDLLFSTAVLYEKMGDWEKAISLMKEVIKTNPQNSQALNFVGYTYAEKNIHLDEAENLINEALKIRPGDGYILDSLGWVAYQKADYKKAYSLLMRANQAAPNEPTVLEHLGDILIKMGNKKSARLNYEKALFILNARKIKIQKDETQIQKIRDKLSLI